MRCIYHSRQAKAKCSLMKKNQIYFKKMGFILLVLLMSLSAMAQDKTISGIVTDETGGPIPGVTVAITGKAQGTITDMQGKYLIMVPNEAESLSFSFIGMKTLTIKINKRTAIDVVMESEVISLEEVVAVGYGSMKRKNLTGAVGTVKAEELDKVKPVSFEAGLASRVAGVQIVSSEGGPDAALKIRVRGGTSINASNDPLYVVDGFPISGGGVSVGAEGGNSTTSPLATLDPSTIESIDILKDASATAIYGSRGANGVVIITTKKGKKGRATLNFETFHGISSLSNRLDVLSAQGFIDYRNDYQPWAPDLPEQQKYLAESYRKYDEETDTWVPISAEDPGLIVDDWQDAITRTAYTHSYSLSATGGSEKGNYNASFSYLDKEGIIKTSGIERYTANLNIRQNINKRLSTGIMANIGYTTKSGVVSSSSFNNQGRSGVVTSAVLFSPVQSPRQWPENEYDENGRLIANKNGDVSNPHLMLEYNSNEGTTLQARTNVFLEYELAKGLKFRSSMRGFLMNTKTKAYFTEKVGWAKQYGGQATTSFSNSQSIVLEQNLSYSKTFGDHAINAVAVMETQKNKYEYLTTTSRGFELPGVNLDALQSALEVLPSNSSETQASMQSYLVRVQYDAWRKYLITASARYDGSSKFAEGNKWGFFPSLGIAWRISNEGFLKNNEVISDAKLRASYGKTGNNEIGSYRSLPLVGLSSYVFGGDVLTTGGSISRLQRDDLTWETTKSYDVGANLGLFKNRINIEANYYDKKTTDLLLQVPLPATSGYRWSFRNLGEVSNKGWEFSLGADIIKKGNFKWDANVNISFNRNKVLDLGGAKEFFETAIGDNQINSDYVVRVGESLGSVYGLTNDGVYTFNDFVDFEGMTDAEAAAKMQADAADAGVNWYTLDIYTLKEGVVRSSVIAGDNQYRPGMTKFVDQKTVDTDGDGIPDAGDGVINSDDRTIIGNTLPKHFGGLTNNFRYKRLDLSVQCGWSYGNDIYNKGIKKGSQTANPWTNKLAIVDERWSPNNPSGTLTSFSAGSSGDINSAAYSRYIEDGSYFRISNITMGYNVSPNFLKKFGINGLRLYGSIDNVAVWTKYSGWDPDVSVGVNQLTPGLDVDSYPRERTLRLGLNATF